jgi:hypothetical protein
LARRRNPYADYRHPVDFSYTRQQLEAMFLNGAIWEGVETISA